MIQLRVRRSELTYEGELSPPVPALIDGPGRLAVDLVAKFDHLGLSLADLTIDDGEPEDRGLTCELEKLEARVSLRADWLEVCFSAIEKTGDDRAADTIRRLWQVLSAAAPATSVKSHSVHFEIDCEALGGTYQQSLDSLCRAPGGLPSGTETAVVYYLPREDGRGYLDSSIVLNRSAEVDGGVLLAATFVFDGNMFASDAAISLARTRLQDLLSRLEVRLSRD
jgi:hypothetical protein